MLANILENVLHACIVYVHEDNGQEPLNAPSLNGLFSSGFSRGKTAPLGRNR